MTSKRRNGAGRGGRGMWGRAAGEAVVWLAARPRGRRPAHLGTSCSFGGWPRTCTKPERLPQPNNSRPVPKPGIPGERIRRGPSSPALCRHASPSPGLVPAAPGPGFSPLPTVHICWPNPRKAGFCERTRAPLLLRGPLQSLNLSLLWHQRRRGRVENESRMRKSTGKASGSA